MLTMTRYYPEFKPNGALLRMRPEVIQVQVLTQSILTACQECGKTLAVHTLPQRCLDCGEWID